MFETASNMIQQHLPAGEHRGWVVGLIALVIAWVALMVIREFWCWFWRTTHLLIALFKIYQSIQCACEIGAKCQEELKSANAKLERIAESIAATAANTQAGSGGNKASAA